VDLASLTLFNNDDSTKLAVNGGIELQNGVEKD
jgi:hypothetical protein